MASAKRRYRRACWSPANRHCAQARRKTFRASDRDSNDRTFPATRRTSPCHLPWRRTRPDARRQHGAKIEWFLPHRGMESGIAAISAREEVSPNGIDLRQCSSQIVVPTQSPRRGNGCRQPECIQLPRHQAMMEAEAPTLALQAMLLLDAGQNVSRCNPRAS